jgi:hypothetical protein
VKRKKIAGEQNPKPAAVAAGGKSSFSHVNQGSSQGHEARHWLEGEAQWRAERKPVRAQGAGTK